MPITSLAANSQGHLKIDYGFVGGRQVSLMCDSGGTILGIRRSLLDESHISNKKIKYIIFGGSVESFNLASIYLESPLYLWSVRRIGATVPSS